MYDHKPSDSLKITEFIERQQIALEIAQLGGRISLIVHLTGLNDRTARSIVEEVTGDAPSKGKRPYSIDSFLMNTASFLQATVLVKLYRNYRAINMTHVRSFLEAFKECKRIHGNDLCLTIDQWHVVSKHLENKAILTMARCKTCHTVIIKKPGRLDPCPACVQLSLVCENMPHRRRKGPRY